MLFYKMQMQNAVLQIYFLSCAFFPNSPAISFLHSFMFTDSFVIFCWNKKGKCIQIKECVHTKEAEVVSPLCIKDQALG